MTRSQRGRGSAPRRRRIKVGPGSRRFTEPTGTCRRLSLAGPPARLARASSAPDPPRAALRAARDPPRREPPGATRARPAPRGPPRTTHPARPSAPRATPATARRPTGAPWIASSPAGGDHDGQIGSGHARPVSGVTIVHQVKLIRVQVEHCDRVVVLVPLPGVHQPDVLQFLDRQVHGERPGHVLAVGRRVEQVRHHRRVGPVRPGRPLRRWRRRGSTAHRAPASLRVEASALPLVAPVVRSTWAQARRRSTLRPAPDAPGSADLEVRIRLGSNLARFAPSPMLRLELPAGATIADLYARLASSTPELGPALASALPVVAGAHVDRARTLAPGEEVALLTPVAGGC